MGNGKMTLYDRPYSRDVVRAELSEPVDVRFDHALLAAAASTESLARRGLERHSGRHEDDPEGVWATTTLARQCDELRDFEAACGLAFESELVGSRDTSEETGEINALLGPVRAALIHDGPSRAALQRALAQYTKGLWDECATSLEDVLRLEPESAEAWLLKAQVALRVRDERGALEAARTARNHTEPGTDVRLYATYVIAFLATRAGAHGEVLDVARQDLGALGAEQGVGLWSRAAESIARDLAFLALKACGRLALAGSPIPFPAVYDRARALVSRHPAAALRMAADEDLSACRDEVLRAIREEHEHVRREVEDMLARWRQSLDAEESDAAEEARRSFDDEARRARSKAALSLLSACDARARVRAISPDATRGPFAQRAWVSELDAPDPSTANVTAIAPPPAEESAQIRWRREIERKREEAEEAAMSGANPLVREVEAEFATASEPPPWATLALGCFAASFALWVAPGLPAVLGKPVVDMASILLLVVGLGLFAMALRERTHR